MTELVRNADDLPLPEPSYVIGGKGYSGSDMRAYGKAVRAEERECLRVMIAALHREAKGQHNLYHCLAVELFGDADIRKGE